MTAVAPGGALREGRVRPGAILPALKPVLRPVLGPVVRPVRPVLRAARGAVVPSRAQARAAAPAVPAPARPAASPVTQPVTQPAPQLAVQPVTPLAVQPVTLPSQLPAGSALPVQLRERARVVPVPVPPADGPLVPAGTGAGAASPADVPAASGPPALTVVRAPAPSPRRRLLVPLSAAAGVGVLAWALLASPYATVGWVEVSGASQRWAPAVRAAAAGATGRPLLLAGGEDIRARVAAVPGVQSVTVGVRWPGVLTVAVVERPAAVAVPVPGGVRLFAADGVDLGLDAVAPAGLPLLTVPQAGLGPRTVLAAQVARRGLPAALAAEVTQVGATSPDGVWFALRGGVRVVWGGAGDGALKADVLAALRRAVPAGPGTTFDVSAPDAPAVSAS